MKENLIIWEKYIGQIRPFIGKNVIKVISGQRRVGKSCILMQLMEDVEKSVPKANSQS